MTIDTEEIFDVVDQRDRVIAQASRNKVHRQGLLHRAIHVFVFTECGEMFMQRRSMNKDAAPGLWSSSCSGHVDAGENYKQAALRELNEEIGLTLSSEQMQLRLTISPCLATENEFVRLYHCQAEAPLCLDPREVMDGRWLPKAQLDEWIIEESDHFTPAFLQLYALDCFL